MKYAPPEMAQAAAYRLFNAAEDYLSALSAPSRKDGEALEELRKIRGEVEALSEIAVSEGHKLTPIPSAIHIKLDMIDEYARTAIASLSNAGADA
jgi:hypothetical protein